MRENKDVEVSTSSAMNVVIAIVVVILVVSIGGQALVNRQERDRIESIGISDILQEVNSGFDESFCDSVSTSLKENKFLSTAIKNRNLVASAAKKLDVWSARPFTEKNVWINQRALESASLKASLDKLIVSQALTTLQSKGLDDHVKRLDEKREDFAIDLRSGALTACGLAKKFQTYVDILDKFNQGRAAILELASQYPWYPKGFSEVERFPGFAYKNKAGNACSYGASCASFAIVSEVSCPNTLYVEVNFYDSSGAVVDWSNDTAQALRAGQIARLAANSYKSGGGGWSFSEISCY